MQSVPRDFDMESMTDAEAGGGGDEDVPFVGDDDAAAMQRFMSSLDDREVDTQSSKEEQQKQAHQQQYLISVRRVFTSLGEDRVIISADYCQLEFRIIANLCGDRSLVDVFNTPGGDVFVLLACKWLRVDVDQVDEEKRQTVKKVLQEYLIFNSFLCFLFFFHG